MLVLARARWQHGCLKEYLHELRKYQDTWDISVVLKVLENWKLNYLLSKKKNITLKDLSLRLAKLLALTTSQLIQPSKRYQLTI